MKTYERTEEDARAVFEHRLHIDRLAEKMEGEHYTADVTLGALYHVQRLDGSWHMAEVIQKRDNPETKCKEYYVHYKDCEYLS